ncbi:MAG: type II secretion system protein GspD, partial [Achromobacter sp.]|nr:type II secretion system protein GspD [Achromobacter sp.]
AINLSSGGGLSNNNRGTTISGSTSGGLGTSSSSNGSLGSGTRLNTGTGLSSSAETGSATGGIIQADVPTNSLIITAPEPLYRQIRAVIDQLDSRRAQVLVEGLIVEVSAEKAAQFGVQWQSLLGQNGSVVGVIGNNFTVGGTNLFNMAAGIAAGNYNAGSLPSPGMNLGLAFKHNGDYVLGALANLLHANADGNILATPNLLTLDNQSASILVGKTVPFVTGQYVTSGSNGSSNPFQTIEREDVGLKLNIRPQISEGGAVKLDIYQEVSSIDETRSSPTTGIVTNKRAIDTSVLIDDGQIIVLGGLLEDSVSLSSDAVPGLGSIPVLGALFRYDTRKRTKTNLMVFLRPYVVRDARRSASVTMDRYDYMRRAQAGAQPGKHWLLPDLQAPMLPPPGSAPSVSNNAYDMRPEQLADTMRRPPPVTVESFAVRQYPAAAQPADPALPIRVNLPRGVSVAVDPESLYGEADRSSATLQFASVEARADADKIAQRVRASGLQAYVQLGPGGMGYVVRSQVAKDPGTISTATALLRELGYKSEVVSQL